MADILMGSQIVRGASCKRAAIATFKNKPQSFRLILSWYKVRHLWLHLLRVFIVREALIALPVISQDKE